MSKAEKITALLLRSLMRQPASVSLQTFSAISVHLWIPPDMFIYAVGSGFSGQPVLLCLCMFKIIFWNSKALHHAFLTVSSERAKTDIHLLVFDSLSHFFFLLGFYFFFPSNDFSRMVAEEYLGYFNFTGQTLDQALRSVCLMSFNNEYK